MRWPALLLLAAEAARAQGKQTIAATVDHGLRPEAADEARCKAIMAARSAPARVLAQLLAPGAEATALTRNWQL